MTNLTNIATVSSSQIDSNVLHGSLLNVDYNFDAYLFKILPFETWFQNLMLSYLSGILSNFKNRLICSNHEMTSLT